MRQTIDAIYEQGVLRPLQRLNLREGGQVRLSLEEENSNPADLVPENDDQLIAMAGCLKDSPRFNSDPVALQRALRDEWT